QFLEFFEHEFDALEFVRPAPVVSQARGRQAPRVADVGIKIDSLIRIRQVLGLRGDAGITREVFREEVAIRRAPSWNSGWGVHADGRADWPGLEVRGCNADLCAPDEAVAGVVEIVGVEVVQSMPLRARSHIDVDVTVVECGEHARADVGHQMFAYLAARISETVWKLGRLGKQQQARIVVDEGSKD